MAKTNLFGNKTADVPAQAGASSAPQAMVHASATAVEILEMGFDPAENLKDEQPEIPQIKVLPQAQMFRMPDESTASEIKGIIVETFRCNGWWDKDSPREDNRPACSSLNDIVPLAGSPNQQSDKCATCKRNVFGSDVDDKGKPGSGKACKNMRRIYILMGDHEFPLLVSLSPTSLKSAKKYLTSLSDRKRHVATVLTRITLRKEVRGSNVFSVAEFAAVEDINDPDMLARILKIRKQVVSIAHSQAITGEEYAAEEAPDSKEPF
jgi:hypothetical protein